VNELIEKPNRSIHTVQTPQELGLPTPAGCPSLSAALAQARDKCEAASKDKKHHLGYAYASADEVIATANAALEGTGLALLPVKEELIYIPAGNSVFYAINRTLILSHSSGEFVTLEVKGFPVNLEGKKTLDKCYLAALTTSYAYKLRDLLQMPRGDEHDIAGRDDRQPAIVPPPQAPQPQPQPEPAPAPQQEEPRPNSQAPAPQPATNGSTPPNSEIVDEATYQKIVTFIMTWPEDQRVNRVKAICGALQIDHLSKTPVSRLDWLRRVMTEGFCPMGMVDRLADLVGQLKIDWQTVGTRLREKYQVSSFGHLLTHQAKELIETLENALKAKQTQQQAA